MSWWDSLTEAVIGPDFPTVLTIHVVAPVHYLYRSLALVDGEVDCREEAAIEFFIRELNKQFPSPIDSRWMAKILANDYEDYRQGWLTGLAEQFPDLKRKLSAGDTPSEQDRLVSAIGAVPQDLRFRAGVFKACFRIAAMDGLLLPVEMEWLGFVAPLLGMHQDGFNLLARAYYRVPRSAESYEAAFEILNVPQDASFSDVEASYNDMMRKYGPDVHKGLAPEIQALAESKWADITAAYKFLTEQDEWFGMHPESGAIIRVKARPVVQCFGCGRATKMVPPEDHWTARCPDCQMLLLFSQAEAAAMRGVLRQV